MSVDVNMDSLLTLIVYSVLIVIISVIGGILPLIRDWSPRQLRLFTGFSAGVFIGATFLILIPDAAEAMNPGDALFLVMIGFVILLAVEIVLHRRHQQACEGHNVQHEHLLTCTTAFIGLGVHSAMDGFALGVAVIVNQEIGVIVFLAIMVHKAIDVFSLSTTFCLAELSRKRSLISIGLFSLITPLAALASIPLLDWLKTLDVGIPLALAGGTFLYVGLLDLLPEALEEQDDNYKIFVLVVLGIAVMYILGNILKAANI
jgi:zinc transporter ZupT